MVGIGWNEPGVFEVKVIAEDENGAQSDDWSEPLIVTVNSNAPPNTPNKPSGPTPGRTDFSYTYTTKTTDPNGDQVKYGWDWGDGSSIEWTPFYTSNQEIERSHTFSEEGEYNIKVKAKDMFELESESFSEPLTVTIQDPELEDQIFDYNADFNDKKWINDLAIQPDDKDIHFGSRQAFNQINNQNDIFIPQTNIGEAYIGYEYYVPIIDGEGILHKARLTVDGDYDQFLEISGFGQIANIIVELFVEEVGSEYLRREEVYTDSLNGWSLDFLINWDDDVSSYTLPEQGSLNEDDYVWLYMDLKEGYTYKFWLLLTSEIITTGLPGGLISLITGAPCPDLTGYANSDNNVHFDFLKLEWVDNVLFSSLFGNNHRPNIPNSPSYSGEDHRIGDNIEFSTYISDPDGDNMECRWYWGDGTHSSWMGPYSSGRTITASHVWDEVGTYRVEVEVKDVNGVWSGRSSPTSVFIDVCEPEGSITITLPSGDDIQWAKGQNYQIKWTTEGDVGDFLSIDLVKEISEDSYDLVRSIAVVDSSDNTYSWTPNVNPDDNYRIMIYGTNSIDLSEPIEIIKNKNKGIFDHPVVSFLRQLFERFPFLDNFLKMYSNI
jgi:hypothetical protein